MFEQVKAILTEKYQSEISKFEELKKQIDNLEQTMREDSSEEEYKNNLNELNKKFGLFKRGSKKYKEELINIKTEYMQKLRNFEALHNNCVEIKNEAARINIYIIQKKLEQLMNANSLEDIKMSEEEANDIISEGVNS